ncbi:MAG: hypothetical protein RL134_608 [Actinomycetota bacterium]
MGKPPGRLAERAFPSRARPVIPGAARQNVGGVRGRVNVPCGQIWG